MVALPSPSGLYMWAFMETRSITPRKPFSAPMGNCSGDDGAAENLIQGFRERSKLESSRSIQVRTNARGNVVFGAVIPNFFGGDLHADVGVDGDERGIGGDQRGFGFGDKGGVAGEIEKIDFYVVAGAKRAGAIRRRRDRFEWRFCAQFLLRPNRWWWCLLQLYRSEA